MRDDAILSRVWDAIRTLAVVAPITLAIWLLAESESLRREKVRIEVTFAAAEQSTRVVRPLPPGTPGQEFAGSATVTFEGPTARVDALAARLRGSLTLEPGMTGVPTDVGRFTVDLQAALAGHPTVRDARVTVTSVEPSGAVVQVDELIWRDARVRVALPDGAGVEGAPEVNPPTVRVRLPASAAALLEGYGGGPGGTSGEAEVVVRLSPDQLAGLPEGRRMVINQLAVELPPGVRELDSVLVQPAQVSVTLTPRVRTATWALAAVPVHVRLGPTELDRWLIELAPESRSLTDVRLTGPAAAIDGMRTSGLRVIAYVPLSFEELEKASGSAPPGQPGVIEKEPTLGELPTPVRVEAGWRPVRVLVRRR